MEPILEPIRKGSKPSSASKLPKRAPKTGIHWDPARSRFVADWVDSSGKRHRPRFKTREEAEARLAEIRAIQNDQDRVGASLTAAERWDAGFGLGLWKAAGREYEPGYFTNLIREKLGSASARKITFATAAESRLKDLAVTAKGGEGGRTYRSAKNRLGAFAGLGKMLLSEIRREDIEKILDKLGAKPGGYDRRNHLAVLGAVFSHAQKQGWLDAKPTANVAKAVPVGRIEAPEPTPITAADAAKLVEIAIRTNDRLEGACWVLLRVFLGLRDAEAGKVPPVALDLEKGVLRLTKAVAKFRARMRTLRQPSIRFTEKTPACRW